MFLNLIPQTPKPTRCIFQKKKKKLHFNIGYYYTGQRKRQILLNVRILYKGGKKYPRNKFYYSQSLRNYVQLIHLKI